MPADFMSTISIQIPDSVRKHVERLAADEGISVDQFYASAAAEKLAAIETSYIAARAVRADRDAFLRVLAKVPSGGEPAADSDRLPN